MEKSYSFTSDTEPTKEQLDELMRSVLKDVQERAEKAEAKFKTLQSQALAQTLDIWHRKQNKK